MTKTFHRSVLLAFTLALATLVYAFVPPPQGVRAFEAQSTWGGAGGGSANAQTIAIANVQSLNDVLGVPLRYVPAADNTGPATIAINGLTATAVRRPSNIGLVALSGGELQAGVAMTVMYNGSTIEIQGPLDMTPIGSTCQYRGSATPRGCLVEDGSAVSRTTYAALFSVIGTNYGSGDGTTTFNLPFSNGRSFVALDNQGTATANVVTSAGSGCAATTVINCGTQSQTLTTTQLPVTAPAITVTNGVTTFVTTTNLSVTVGGTTVATPGVGAAVALPISGNITATTSFGSGAAHSILNPISLGRRAIKF